MQPNELISKLLVDIVKELGMEEKMTSGMELEMGERTVNGMELKRFKKFRNGTMEKHHNDKVNITDVLKPVAAGLVVELKKLFASKKPAISLYGTMQRVTGDFWIAFTSAIRALGGFLDVLFSPILAALQPSTN
uniref:Transmembrane protein n=1 Tax=Elaeophora elaphi TaxID=1147741 RepID=A0A0R3RXX5_9BILA